MGGSSLFSQSTNSEKKFLVPDAKCATSLRMSYFPNKVACGIKTLPYLCANGR